MELADKGQHGIVEDAVFMGSPTTADGEAWAKMRSVVAGRLVNVWSGRDWMLAVLVRVRNWSLKISGLQEVRVAGVENLGESRRLLPRPGRAVLDRCACVVGVRCVIGMLGVLCVLCVIGMPGVAVVRCVIGIPGVVGVLALPGVLDVAAWLSCLPAVCRSRLFCGHEAHTYLWVAHCPS